MKISNLEFASLDLHALDAAAGGSPRFVYSGGEDYLSGPPMHYFGGATISDESYQRATNAIESASDWWFGGNTDVPEGEPYYFYDQPGLYSPF